MYFETFRSFSKKALEVAQNIPSQLATYENFRPAVSATASPNGAGPEESPQTSPTLVDFQCRPVRRH